MRLWGSHISLKTLPKSRGSQLEIFFIIKNLQKTNFILGGMGNGIYNYLYFKQLSKYFKNVSFATSVPLSLKSLENFFLMEELQGKTHSVQTAYHLKDID